MSKIWAIFWGLLALPSFCAVSCSGRVSGGSPLAEDSGSAGMPDIRTPPEHDSGLQNTDCAKLSVAQCAAGRECQVLEAQLQSPRCATELEAVGCFSVPEGCGAAETHAADPQGRQWLFLSTCIPFGWRELAPSTPDPCGVGGAAD
ncbi:MAG TPA: hypothetical protein VHW01_31680 [Polyangiaceae bacterium]|nr:hypothetical protein [Polyangiaceae bacterium]